MMQFSAHSAGNSPNDAAVTADIWVVSLSPEDDLTGRLGDARDLADQRGWTVGVLRFDPAGQVEDHLALPWIHQGADTVLVLRPSAESQSGWIDAALEIWRQRPPWLILTSADRVGRAWSARLAARTGWTLVSPALLVQSKPSRLLATRLHGTGRHALQVELPTDAPAIVAIRPGVAQALPADSSRQGTIVRRSIRIDAPSGVLTAERIPADPGQTDIRFVPKLIAGGRGVGGREGFVVLRRIADKLGAGLAASRMAVDLGWIEQERQVGQTGRTVKPELYLACGISGASHHIEGMSESRHVVAINTDARAPLMQRAELAIQADLHLVLKQLDELLESTV